METLPLPKSIKKISGEDANNWFIDQTDRLGLKQGTQAYNDLAAEFAHRTGMVPEPTMDYARSVLSSQAASPEQVVAAAETVARMAAASPRGYEYADDGHKLGMIADSVNKLVGAGLPAAEAVKTARDNFAMGEASRKIMLDKWATAQPFGKKDSALDGVLEQQLHEVPGLNVPGALWGTNVPDRPPALQADYAHLTEEMFIHNGGDLAQAQAAAAKAVSAKWGITTMNGAPEIVKYPPERVFRASDGSAGLTAETIRADIAHHISGDFKDAFQRWNPEERKLEAFTPAPDRVKLVAIPNVTEGTGGLRWGAMYQDDAGTVEPLFDKHNNPVTYDMPVRSSKEYAETRAAAVEDRRKQQLKQLHDSNLEEAGARKSLEQDRSLGITSVTLPRFLGGGTVPYEGGP